MHIFVPCQIDVLNKQLVSPVMSYRHLDAKEKHTLDIEGVYNM